MPARRAVERLRTRISLVCVLTLSVALFAAPAWAHDEGEPREGYLLVQQALGHLAHDTTMDGIMGAIEKVDDALGAEDLEGVDVAEVQQARAALEAGRPDQAKALLQHSISAAVSHLEPATGDETGTAVVLEPLPGRGDLTGADWGVLAASLALVLLGGGLARRFGPADSVGQLRRQLGDPARGQPAAGSGPEDPS